MSCQVEGCAKQAVARGMRKAHWHRDRRYGSATGGFYRGGVASEWLAAHVGHRGDECLIWPYGRNGRGYGAVTFRGKQVGAHRAMCILTHGDAPAADSHAAHSCGNGHKGCINPHHLSWKTPTENQRDRFQHGTDSRGAKGGSAKVSEQDVRRIRQRIAAGEAQTAIAADFNVTNHAIRAIASRRTWAWL